MTVFPSPVLNIIKSQEVAKNIIRVGSDLSDNFTTIEEALASIVSSGTGDAYVVAIKPGEYVLSEPVVIPPYVTIKGSGTSSTRIICSAWMILKASPNTAIYDLTIVGSALEAVALVVAVDENVTDFKMRNVDMYLTGGIGAAIAFRSYTHTTFLNNVNIYTTSTGMILQGYHYFTGVNIFLSGDATGTDYVGILIPHWCRLYAWSCKIGTGYGLTNVPGFGSGLEVHNDPTSSIVGILVPENNPTIPRIQLHGFESFCRNAYLVTPPPSGNGVSCIRAYKGWFRLFGSFVQSEAPHLPSAEEALYQSGSGAIEVYGTRYSASTGNIVSRGQNPVSYYDVTDDTKELTNWEGGVIFCDASGGSFGISINPHWVATNPGTEYRFVKSDSSANTVTITSIDLKLVGGGTTIVLSQPYESVTLIAAGKDNDLFIVN